MVLTTLTHILLVSPCLRVGVLCCDMSGACYSLPGVIRGQYKRRGVIATLTLCCSHVGQAVQSDRAVARAVRELSAHIACDWHVASGAYLVSPDNKRLKTLRPTCRADFESRWGAICYAPPDDLLAVGARLKFAI